MLDDVIKGAYMEDNALLLFFKDGYMRIADTTYPERGTERYSRAEDDPAILVGSRLESVKTQFCENLERPFPFVELKRKVAIVTDKYVFTLANYAATAGCTPYFDPIEVEKYPHIPIVLKYYDVIEEQVYDEDIRLYADEVFGTLANGNTIQEYFKTGATDKYLVRVRSLKGEKTFYYWAKATIEQVPGNQ